MGEIVSVDYMHDLSRRYPVNLTTGRFNLLLPHHYSFLRQCAEMSGWGKYDVFAVGINGDESVMRYLRSKGREAEVLFPAKQRAEMLSSVVGVQYVFVFDRNEDGSVAADASPVLRTIMPRRWLKGAYTWEQLTPEEQQALSEHEIEFVEMPMIDGVNTGMFIRALKEAKDTVILQ